MNTKSVLLSRNMPDNLSFCLKACRVCVCVFTVVLGKQTLEKIPRRQRTADESPALSPLPGRLEGGAGVFHGTTPLVRDLCLSGQSHAHGEGGLWNGLHQNVSRRRVKSEGAGGLCLPPLHLWGVCAGNS